MGVGGWGGGGALEVGGGRVGWVRRGCAVCVHLNKCLTSMTTDGGTTTDHCDTEGMTEEVAAENAPLVNGQGYVWAEGYGGRPGWVLCVD